MTSPPRSYGFTGRRPAAVEIAFWIAQGFATADIPPFFEVPSSYVVLDYA